MPRPAYPDRHEHLTSIRRAATAAADAGGAGRGTLRASPGVPYCRAAHPLPNEGSLAAAQAAADLLACAGPDDLLLALVSGGGSAMFELPRAGVSLDDLRAVNRLLLASGAPIAAFNTVRSALSRVKGGGLARLASPARTIGLILSDVVGDRISAIPSGPPVLTRRGPGLARRAP